MKKIKRVLAVVVVFCFILALPVSADSKYIPKNEANMFFDMVASDLVQIYQFDITKDELLTRTFQTLLYEDPDALDTFLRAMFASLDEYSEFYTAEEYEALTNYIDNVTGGFGVQMQKRGNYAEITLVTENSAAQAAGLMEGDKIVELNGENMVGKALDYVQLRMKGEIGTTIPVKVLRGEQILEFQVTRQELPQSTVTAAQITSDAAIITITTFSQTTDEELDQILQELDANGVKKIVLDLRDNGGGYVDSAVNIARHFVPEGIIVTHRSRYNDYTEEYRSTLKETRYELVTLVNENTASASELLASALSESGASKLVGRQTYGKSVTQSILGLYGGRMCKVTTGEYLTRSGKSINGIGITPDITVDNEIVAFGDTTALPMQFAAQYQLGDAGEGVFAAKQRLRLLDFDVGTLDDTFTEQMQEAVMAYQESRGLEKTGILDINTQVYLENDTSGLRYLSDNQLAAALELLGVEYELILAK